MRKKLRFWMLIAFACCSGSMYSQLTPDLLFYRFENAGTTVTNEATTPPPGTATANILGTITQAPGSLSLCGNSLIGSGNTTATDNVSTGWATNLPGSWTISLRSTGISASPTLYYVFSDPNAGSLRCFTNGIAGNNNYVLRGTGITDAFCNGCALTTPTMSTWVYDQTVNTIYVYLNGVLINTVAQAGTPIINSVGPFRIMGYNATNVGAPAGGQMDDFRVYGRALSAAEVMQVYSTNLSAGFLGADTAICTTATIQLGDANWLSPTWSTGETTPTITASAPDTVIVSASAGCNIATDTIILATQPNQFSTINPVACNSYTSPSGMYVYTASGTYQDVIPAVLGCDSIITINLTLNSTRDSITVTECGNTYTAPSGALYTAAGTYQDTIPNAAGCDSLLTISLSFSSPSYGMIMASACDSYTAPSGAVYTTSGTYMDTIPNSAGCDSIITVMVDVYYSQATATTVNACGTSWTSPGGQVWTQSGTYTDSLSTGNGCDSLVTITLNLENITASFLQSGGTLTASPSGAASYQWWDCTTNQPINGATSMSFNPAASGNYAVIVNGQFCADTTGCQQVTIVASADPSAPRFACFPNPTSGELRIQASQPLDNAALYVFTAEGREVRMQPSLSGMEHRLNLQDLPAGIYLLEIRQDGAVSRQRIVKQ